MINDTEPEPFRLTPELQQFEQKLASMKKQNHPLKHDLETMYRCGWEAAVAVLHGAENRVDSSPKVKPE